MNVQRIRRMFGRLLLISLAGYVYLMSAFFDVVNVPVFTMDVDYLPVLSLCCILWMLFTLGTGVMLERTGLPCRPGSALALITLLTTVGFLVRADIHLTVSNTLCYVAASYIFLMTPIFFLADILMPARIGQGQAEPA